MVLCFFAVYVYRTSSKDFSVFIYHVSTPFVFTLLLLIYVRFVCKFVYLAKLVSPEH